LTILNSGEEDFRRIEGVIHTAKEGVILEECDGCQLAIGRHKLVHDFNDFYGGIPSPEIGIGGEHEHIVDSIFEHVVACSLDVLV
jgi:hypothetical protein